MCTLVAGDVAGRPSRSNRSAQGLHVARSRTPPCRPLHLLAATCTRALAACIAISTVVGQSCIATLGGTPGSPGGSGDGGPATSAKLDVPTSIVVDGSGWIVFTDFSNSVVRRISPSGNISTMAGQMRTLGYMGDGGPATSAQLQNPWGMASDRSGGYLICDTNNHVVRRVNAAGVINRVAGQGGISGYAGDGGFATAANVRMSNPHAVAVDANGGFYVTEGGSSVVRYISNLGIISTVAGSLSAPTYSDGLGATNVKLDRPTGITLFGTDILVSDSNNHAVRRVPVAGGSITTFAGIHQLRSYSGNGFAATSATLAYPLGLSVDAAGTSVLIADSSNTVIRVVSASGIITAVVGNGTTGYFGDGAAATLAMMFQPAGVTSDGFGGILIPDTNNHAIRYVAPAGMCTPAAVACTPLLTSMRCTFASIAQYLQVNAWLAGQPCSMLTFPPATVRNASCPLPTGVPSAALQWITSFGLQYTITVTLSAPTPSATPTTSASSTGTVSNSGTASSTFSSTRSATATSSMSGTSSATGTQSSSSSGTATASSSSTRSSTSSQTASATSTSSATGTGTQSLTSTTSASSTTTRTSSSSQTLSASSSSTCTGSATGSSTTSVTRTSSVTSTPTWSVSRSSPASVTSTSSQTLSSTPSSTPSSSPTSTQTSSGSSSSSGTPSGTLPPSQSSSTTISPSTISSQTMSSTPSLYLVSSASGGETVLLTPAPARSSTSTHIPPPTLSASGSVSAVVSTTTTAGPTSAAMTTSAFASASVSAVESSSATSSQRISISSATSTATALVASTATASSAGSGVFALPSLSAAVATASMTASTSPSAAVVAITLSRLDVRASALSSATAWALRDIDKPAPVLVTSFGCDRRCALACAAAGALRVYPAQALLSDNTSVVLRVWAPFRAANASSPVAAAFACTATRIIDGLSSIAQASVRLTPVQLPLLTDVLLHISTDRSSHLVRSVWRVDSCNITAAASAVIAAVAAVQGSVPPEVPLFGPAVSSRLLQSYDTVLSACASTLSAKTTAFTLTCAEGANITLVARSGFTPAARVRVNGVTVAAYRSSADGRMLHFQVPSMQAMCGAKEECGYVSLRVDTGPPANVSIGCPGLCTDSDGVVPQCNDTCSAAAAGPGGAPPVLLTQQSALYGLFITSACDSAMYLPPGSGACINASDPVRVRCAFGTGSACSACPQNALCPGGKRAWPLPGFYTPSERSGDVVPCPAPSSRCTGWDATSGESSCSVGYLSRSYACGACASGYYADMSGSCAACPSNPTPAASIIPFLIFVGYVLASLLALYLLMLGVALAVKSRTADIHSRMVSLVSWSFLSVQLVAQAGRVAAAGLPSIVVTMYAALAVSQFSGVVVPSSCIAGFPFVNEVSVMAISLAALITAACVVVHAWYHPHKRVHALVLRAAVMVVTLAYPATVNSAMSLLVCTPVRISVLAYTMLDGDGSSLARAGVSTSSPPSTLIDVLVQSSNPSNVCYESSHTSAAALAWVATVLVGVLFPCSYSYVIWRRIRLAQPQQTALPLTVEAEKLPARALHPARRVSYHDSRQRQVHSHVDDAKVGGVAFQPLAIGSRGASTPMEHSAEGRVSGRTTQAAADTEVSVSAAAVAVTPLLPQPGVMPGVRSSSCLRRWSLPRFDSVPGLHNDALLAPMLHGDYRPSAFMFYTIDRWTLLSLAVVNACLGGNEAPERVIARTSLVVTVLLVNVLLFASCSPYQAGDSWKHAVKLLALVLTCCITALNAMSTLLSQRSEAASAVTGISFLIFALCLVLLAALPVTFMLSAIRPPPRIRSVGDAPVADAEEGVPRPHEAGGTPPSPFARDNPLTRAVAADAASVRAPPRSRSGSTADAGAPSTAAYAFAFASSHVTTSARVKVRAVKSVVSVAPRRGSSSADVDGSGLAAPSTALSRAATRRLSIVDFARPQVRSGSGLRPSGRAARRSINMLKLAGLHGAGCLPSVNAVTTEGLQDLQNRHVMQASQRGKR